MPFRDSETFKINLDKVSFTTKGRDYPILENITFSIEPRSTVLIDGPSGSGKSTLLRVIAGIAKPSQGDIYVNDVSLKGIYPNHYRAQVGHILAGETPFEGTIYENITFGDKSITEQKINEIIRVVGLREFVKYQPKGINTMIYPEGKQISETISKKILLARALAKTCSLLILEDPLEQFDDFEANRIIDYLLDDNHPWTLVVVGSHPRWRKSCDHIIELERGKIKSDIRNA